MQFTYRLPGTVASVGTSTPPDILLQLHKPHRSFGGFTKILNPCHTIFRNHFIPLHRCEPLWPTQPPTTLRAAFRSRPTRNCMKLSSQAYFSMPIQSEASQLVGFHARHFPGQPVPSLTDRLEQTVAEFPADTVPSLQDSADLGYYHDGTRRTLTDEQIKMFRHSEIQRLVNERRVLKEQEERQKRRGHRLQTSPDASDRKKRRHNDDPGTNAVDTLLYDDVLESVKTPNTVLVETKREFLWPQLRDT